MKSSVIGVVLAVLGLVSLPDRANAAGTLCWGNTDVQVSESDLGARLTVVRTQSSMGSASASFTTVNGTARAGVEYSQTSGAVVFEDQDLTAREVTVPLIDNLQQTGDRTFLVRLSAPTDATLCATPDATVTIKDDESEFAGRIGFKVSSVAFSEGDGTVSIPVSRTNGAVGAVSVNYKLSNAVAQNGADLQFTEGTLTWANNDSDDKNITFTINDDILVEGDETATISLDVFTGGASAGPITAVEMRIVDNDAASNSVLSFQGFPYQVGEASGVVQVRVSRTGGAAGAVEASYQTVAGSAKAGDDFGATTGTLSWADNDATDRLIYIPIVDDTISEQTESFVVTLSVISGNASVSTPSAQVSIVDDETVSPGTISLLSAAVGVSETKESLTIQVARLNGSDGEASVSYTTSSGSATAGQDFESKSGLLRWADGESDPIDITIQLNDDLAVEGNETFTLTLSNPNGAALAPGGSSVTVTIFDDESTNPGTVFLGVSNTNVGEGSGSVSIQVFRSGGAAGAITVPFSTSDGTATGSADYTPASGVLQWADGETSVRTITIPVTNDAVVETDETFSLSIGPASGGASIGSPSVATIRIIDNDSPSPSVISIVESALTVNESSGFARITLRRSGGASGSVSATVKSFSGSALADADFLPVDQTITWPDGDAGDKTLFVTILNDSSVEPQESFVVALNSVTGGASIAQSSKEVEIRILDDDTASAGTVAFVTPTASVREDVDSLQLTVTRTGGARGAIAVSFAAIAGTATAGSDYTDLNGQITWDSNDATPKTITVNVADDTLAEGPEKFRIQLSNVTCTVDCVGTAPVIGSPSAVEVTITDNDTPDATAGSLTFNTSLVVVQEGNTTASQLSVERQGGSDGPVAVRYVVQEGTAIIGDDIDSTTVSGQLNWADGDSSPKTVLIRTVEDSEEEPTEEFTVRLENLSGGATLGTIGAVTVKVLDDDTEGPGAPGTLRLLQSSLTVREDANIVQLEVLRDGGASGIVTVEVRSADDPAVVGTTGSASAGVDYDPIAATVTWEDGEAGVKFVTTTIDDDDIAESAERFQVKLVNPRGAGSSPAPSLGTPSIATVTITDNDAMQETAGVLGMARSIAVVREGDTDLGQITVLRTGGADGAVSVAFRVVEGTARLGADIDPVFASGTLTWPDGDATPRVIPLRTIEDSVAEEDKEYSIQLENPLGGAELGAITLATVKLLDDDTPGALNGGRLRIVGTEIVTGERAGVLQVEVVRDGGSDGDIRVSMRSAAEPSVVGTDLAATPGEDFASIDQELRWVDGELGSKIVTTQIIDDADVELDEIFLVRIFNAAAETAGMPAPVIEQADATVRILDDERSCVGGTVQLARSSYSVKDTAGTAVLEVTRVNGDCGPIAIDFAVLAGTAKPGAEYLLPDVTSLTWTDGETAVKLIAVPVLRAETFGQDKTFQVLLQQVNGGFATIGNPSAATVTIQNTVGESDGGGALGWTTLIALFGLIACRRRAGWRPAEG